MSFSEASQTEKKIEETFKQLKLVFKKYFIENCHLDDASVTSDELETLEELDHTEVAENIKELISSLILFKTAVKTSKNDELVVRCEKLEKMLQKQESDIRKHIGTEYQLKLLIETLQQKNTDLEAKFENAQGVIKGLESCAGVSMNEKIKKLESCFQKELSRVAEKWKNLKIVKENDRINKLENLFEQKEKSYVRLLEDFNVMKGLLEKTSLECSSLRKEIEKYSNNGTRSLSKKREILDVSLIKAHSVVKAGERKVKRRGLDSLIQVGENDGKQALINSVLKKLKRHGRSFSDNQQGSWKKISKRE